MITTIAIGAGILLAWTLVGAVFWLAFRRTFSFGPRIRRPYERRDLRRRNGR